MINPNKTQIQGEDGGWKLEERELEEKRRSLEGQKESQRGVGEAKPFSCQLKSKSESN